MGAWAQHRRILLPLYPISGLAHWYMSACLPGRAGVSCVVCVPNEPEPALGVPAVSEQETRGLVTGIPAQPPAVVIRGIELDEANKTIQCISRTFYCAGNIRTLHD